MRGFCIIDAKQPNILGGMNRKCLISLLSFHHHVPRVTSPSGVAGVPGWTWILAGWGAFAAELKERNADEHVWNRRSRMSIYKVLRLTQRRSFVSSLFAVTFFATVLTVSASEILPCPARPIKGTRFADSQEQLGQEDAATLL